jgi:hypothetical protein
MPVFATPEPISVTIELHAGNVQIVASDRTDTAVEVQAEQRIRRIRRAGGPADPGRVRRRHVDGPRAAVARPQLLQEDRSVEVRIALPAGSQVHGELTSGDVRGTGALEECRFKASVGHFRLDRTGPLILQTTGHVAVDTVVGDAEVSTGSGRVRIGDVDGTAVVKNSNGSTDIGTVTGRLRVRSTNGDVTVGRADAGVEAKASNGSIRIGEVVRGSVALDTATGDLEVGVAAGTAAWLDLKTGHGRVHNELDEIGRGPAEPGKAVQVRAHTSFGDITVRRS